MKKFFALLAVVLAVVSCQKDVDVDVNVGGEVDTVVTVSLPETTRATNSAEGAFDNVVESDEYTIRYIFQVFYNGTESQAARQVIYSDNKVVCFPVRLVPDRHYNFVVWADVTTTAGKTLDTIHKLTIAEATAADIHYNTEYLTNITLKGNWDPMDETRDAFTGHFDTAVDGDKTPYNGAKSINFRLTRPFAKLRVITTDMEQLNDLVIEPTTATVEYTTDLYSSFNAFAGAVNTTAPMRKTHSDFAIEAYDDNVDDKSKVLFTDYFFAADQEEVVNFTLKVYDKDGVIIGKETNFNTPIPARRNYLTTISGNILTDGNNITVEIKPDFANGTEWNPEEDEYDVEVWDGMTVTEPSYDANTKTYTVTNGAELAWIADQVNGVTRAAANNFSGKTIVLAKNINLGGHEWTPIGCAGKPFEGTFDGDDHIVGNFQITNQEGHAGLFGNAHATIKNLTVIDAKIVAHHYAGGIVGQGYVRIDNCHVNNIDITLTTKNGDWGDKAGGIIGQNCEGTLYVKNSSAKNVKIQGYRDLGGIVGMAHNNNIVSDCYAENITILQDLSVNYQNSTPDTLGAVIGRKGVNVTGNNTTGEGIEIAVIIAEGLTQDTVSGDFNVSSAEGLAYIAEQVNVEGNTDIANGDIILNGDIDLASITTFATRSNASNWTPIGTSEKPFKGTFDGKGCTIKNLVIDGGSNSNIGFFGYTINGEIKNVTFENAKVSGRLNVGVVAGTPYTSKYTNITVKGHVEVNGMAYVGAVGGKNAYADWTNITVDVDETSYVNANSVEDGKAYRTYVGGVVGFNGEGGHSFKNITSNINVKGSTIDVGGLFGIAHYGNQFENCVCTGNVEIYNASEEGDAQEIGGIAGVWHPGGADVVMTNCSFTGKLKTNIADVDFYYGGLVGKPYSETGTGILWLNGNKCLANGIIEDENGNLVVNSLDSLEEALKTAGAAGAGDTTIVFAENTNINMTNAEWTPIKVDGYNGADIVTIEGNGAVITGLEAPLFAGGFAGGSGIVIKDLTIKDSYIVSANTIGSGAFIESVDSMAKIELTNCHLLSSTVTGGAGSRTGGLIGWTAGYSNVNDGPVKTYVTIDGCSVIGCTITCDGSVGGINGHAGNNDWTYTTIKNCTIKNNTLASTDDGEWRVGVVVGTANVGEVTISNITENNNTLTQTGKTAPVGFLRNLYGRAVLGATGKLTIDGYKYVAEGLLENENGDKVACSEAGLKAALENGGTVVLANPFTIDQSESNGYGKTGINMTNGGTLDGNGNELGAPGSTGTWDSAINTSGGTIKNIKVTKGFRGIFIKKDANHNEKLYLNNVTIDGTTYTISCDSGNGYGLEATNSTFKGWTSYAATIGEVKFDTCTFGAGSGYNFSRPYAPTQYVNCTFEAGHKMDPRAAVTFENCTVGGVALTAENLSTLVTSNIANASVK